MLLHEKHTGTCCLTKKSFGKVIHNFVYGSDETHMQACNNGTTRVIVSAGCKQHESKYQDLWISIIIYCTRSIDGVNGPNIFLIEGNGNLANYTDKLL